MRRTLAFIYNWVTVLTGIVVGALSFGMDAFCSITGSVDISPLLPPNRAAQIMTIVALVKGMHAFYVHRRSQS